MAGVDVSRGDARYLRIAREIEERIAAGRLRPGDRLPSARQITQEWGVAIATATKVLGALQTAGLARPVPGVGTVVAGPPPDAGAAAPSSITAAERARGAAVSGVEPAAGRSEAGMGARPPVARSAASAVVPGAGASGVPARSATGSVVPGGEATRRSADAGSAPDEAGGAERQAGNARRRDTEPELSRERIVRAAVAVADAEGLGGLSMRRIAAELGVATMSLYRHVPGKEELLLFMSDLVFGDEPLPEPDPGGWREALELIARRQWAMYRAHPWVVHTISFTRPALAPNGMAYTEFAMRSLDGLGLGVAERLVTVLAIFSTVHGVAVNLDWEREAEHESGLSNEEWMQAQEQEFMEITAGRFPLLAEVARIPDFDVVLDDLLELNLTLMLDGLAARYARRRPGRA